MQTQRECILAGLEAKNFSRVCWIPLMSRMYLYSLPQYKDTIMKWSLLMDYPLQIEDLIWAEFKFRLDFCRQTGAGFMQWGGECHKLIRDKVKESRKTEGDRLFVEYRSPLGNLTEEFEFSSKGSTFYRKKFLIDNRQDLKIYRTYPKTSIFGLM